MAAYLIRRLWQMVPTLLGVVLLVFVLFRFFGGDPAEILAGWIATPEQIDAIRPQLGLNEPWWVQLGIFIKQIVSFDWGQQLGHQRVGGAALRDTAAGHADGDGADPGARHAAGHSPRAAGRRTGAAR